MKTTDKIKTVTPLKRRRFGRIMTFVAGLATLTGVLFPFTIPVTAPIAAYTGYLAAQAATDIITIDDVDNMNADEQKVLFERLRDKAKLTEHDGTLMDHLLKDGEAIA